MDKPSRTEEENEELVRIAQTSLWHWSQRADCTPKNLSIGYWQLSRIYAMLADAPSARKYGDFCLQVTPPEDSFCLGYAYEALARAEQIARDGEKARRYLTLAKSQCEKIESGENRSLLAKDMEALGENAT